MLIILGVLIALFFVVTGWGQLSDEPSAGGVAEAIVNMVRGLETKKEPLSPNDLTDADPPDCREQLRRKQFTLPEGQSCRLEVGAASDPVRILTLQLQQGNQVRLRLSAGGEDDTERTTTLPADGETPKTLELQFVREGGRLVIACTDATGAQNQCVIDVM